MEVLSRLRSIAGSVTWRAKAFFQASVDALRAYRTSVGDRLRRAAALGVYRVETVLIRTSRMSSSRWSVRLFLAVIGLVALATILEAHRFDQKLLLLGDKDHIQALQQLFVTVGGALVGATAIAFSLVMFSMQVNVDRLPHGLFRRFTSDSRLLAAFVGTFVISVAIALLSILVEQVGTSRSLLLVAWGTLLILFLFLYAYRRALDLISPTKQLVAIVMTTQRDLRRWAGRARRAEPLLTTVDDQKTDDGLTVRIDAARLRFFRMNPGWTSITLEGLQYAIAFSRRFAERGDHDVVTVALNTVIAINASYIDARGKTFFSTNFLFESSNTTDAVINTTLEHLRQNAQIALSRSDERQLEETFRALAALAQVYLRIEYASVLPSKTHALLAGSYLAGAVQSVVPRNMPDVVMAGLRRMGFVGQQLIAHGESESVATSAEKLAVIGAAALLGKQDNFPVTTCSVEQLAAFTVSLIASSARRDQKFAISEVRREVFWLGSFVVNQVADTPLSSLHSSILGPYFSMIGNQALPVLLTAIVNGVSPSPADNEQAREILDRLEEWADDLYLPCKDLLLVALSKRSHLSLDVIHWVGHVTKILLAASCCNACSEHTRGQLRGHAQWLISVLSWIPGDKETIAYAETFRIADILVEAALDAHDRDCDDVATAIYELLIAWAFKAGRYQTGWGSLHTALLGVGALCGHGIVTEPEVLADIDARISRADAPELDARFRANQDLIETADSLPRFHHTFSQIDAALDGVEPQQMVAILTGIATHLCPEVSAK